MVNKVIVFAGTTEGRLLCEFLEDMEISTLAYVATEYGEEVMAYLKSSREKLKVVSGRLDETQMEEIFSEEKPDMVIDATHPYAVEVTKNIRTACEKKKLQYYRLVRESQSVEDVIWVKSVEDAVEYLNRNTGNIFLTTGSKELEAFTKVKDYRDRMTIRVLPSVEVLQKCLDLGFSSNHIIAMQGPFTEEVNCAMMLQCESVFMVTKDSGETGGFIEKIAGARGAGVTSVVIARPREEEGYTLEEMREMFL